MSKIIASRKYLELLTAFMIILYVSCASNNVSGTSSGVETKIARGSIVHEDGSAATGVRVLLIPADYDPEKDAPLSKSFSKITGLNGEYEFSANDTGLFNIQAILDSNGSRLLIRDIHITAGAMSAPKGTLRPSGAIKVIFPDNIDTLNGYLYIPGTDITISLHGKIGSATIDSVPVGVLPPVHYALRNVHSTSRPLTGEVIVQPGATVTIVDVEWLYSQRIRLNTTSSGAGVSTNQYGLPLLIRLTDSNFSFSQAKSGGEDIRFTKVDDTPLPFEIERWDATARRAEIWVKLDTVYGNDSSHGFIMYWGNPNAITSSNGRAVFDTENGFAGVWHFAEADNNLPGGFKDATANAYNLTGATRTTAGYVDGIIGGAQKFGTVASDSIVGPCPKQLGGNSSFTVSFWIKVDTLLPSRPCILDFGTVSYLTGGHFFLWPDFTAQFGMFDTGGFMSSSDPEPPHQNVFSVQSYSGTWMFVAMVYDAALGTLSSYVNGMIMDKDTISAVQINVNGGIHIGRPYVDYYPGYFNGDIDEVRILSIAQSPDWISLCYKNQRPDNAPVLFK